MAGRIKTITVFIAELLPEKDEPHPKNNEIFLEFDKNQKGYNAITSNCMCELEVIKGLGKTYKVIEIISVKPFLKISNSIKRIPI